MQPLHLLAGKTGLAYLVEMVIPIRLPVFGLLLELPFMLTCEDRCGNSPTKATSGQQQQQSAHIAPINYQTDTVLPEYLSKTIGCSAEHCDIASEPYTIKMAPNKATINLRIVSLSMG